MSREQKGALSKLIVLLLAVAWIPMLFLFKCDKQNDEGSHSIDSMSAIDISWEYYVDKTPSLDSNTYVKTIIVPIEKVSNCIGNKDCLNDSSKYVKSVGDSAVGVPIVQKVYSDSTYTAYVSGYEPRLDSIRLKYPIVTNTITRTVTIKKTRKWNVGVIGGYGYGILSNKIEPFIGIGFSYSLFGK